MKENPGLQAKWDGGCLRGNLTSSKLAVLGKEEQDGNVDSEQEIIWKAAYRVAHTNNAGEGGLQESLTGMLSRRCELSVQ